MDNNLLLQYIIVGVLIAAACIWIIVKFIRASKGNGGGCCGCALSDTCHKKEKRHPVKTQEPQKECCPHCNTECEQQQK